MAFWTRPIAFYQSRLAGLNRRLLNPRESPQPSFVFSAWLFLRALGLIYGVAFVSLWSQLEGLIGQGGILPVGPFLQAAKAQVGASAYGLLPTLCWLSASDATLHLLCALGAGLAVLLFLDVAPAFSLFGAWACYLSLATVSRNFLWFQWDSLLLEVGFLSIFLSPLRMAPRPAAEWSPPSIILRLFHWLLFRLMFASGAVKWTSGDPAWRDLTALSYHYETQPLPTWIGWAAHQLPAWFHVFSCAAMFAIELLMPFLIFASAKGRRLAAILLIAFQLLITATGNYAFFNLLTIALCVLLLDDAAWPSRWRKALARPGSSAASSKPRSWPKALLIPLAMALWLLSIVPLVSALRGPLRGPVFLARAYEWLQPLRLVNNYGLFAVMTTARPEIVLEGSSDGREWRAYAFKDKPGDLQRRPRFIAPHQPRLDWQMWFAALGTYQDTPWFLPLCRRLLQGSPEVLSLLAFNPFPEAPPRYVRALLYTYHFTDWNTRRTQGTWWRRELKGLYCPAMSLRE